MERNHVPPASPYPNAAVLPKAPPTPAPPKVALCAAILALLCSILMYPSIGVLFGNMVFGVNVPLSVAALYAAYLLAMRGQRKVRWRRGLPLFSPILLLSCALALYSVPELVFLNLCALGVLIPLHLSLLSGGNWPALSGGSLICQAASDIFARPFAYVSDGCRATMGGSKKGALRNVLLSLAGAAVALPLLWLVMSLLMAADSQFNQIVSSIFGNIDGAQVFLTSILAVAFLFPCISILYSLPLGKKVERAQAAAKEGSGIHPIPVYTLLAMFDAVLLLFAAVQIVGIFTSPPSGAREYADQAHQVFSPMLAAALICYGVQWACLRFTRREGHALPLRILVTAMAAGLLVMMASALKAILHYELLFGLTRLRVYVTICIVALFMLLVLTLLKVWTKRTPYRALVCGVLMASLLTVNFINVDKTIATFNTRNHLRSAVDAEYLLTLSADGLAVCAENPIFASERLAEGLAYRLKENERFLWYARAWNSGRADLQRVYEKMPGYEPQSRTAQVIADN